MAMVKANIFIEEWKLTKRKTKDRLRISIKLANFNAGHWGVAECEDICLAMYKILSLSPGLQNQKMLVLIME